MKIKVDQDIEIRSVRIKSAKDIFKCIDASREYLRQWLPFVEDTLTWKDTENYIKSVVHDKGAIKDLVFEVWHHERIVGLISMKDIDLVNNKAEIGYWLSKEAVGKGIITRSCRALIAYAFDDIKLNKIWIRCAVENIRSCNIPKQLGFTFEGIERQGERLHGKYVDLKVYSLLRREWMRQRSINS
jgi:ribosomal-protein-serine acetyltransferase